MERKEQVQNEGSSIGIGIGIFLVLIAALVAYMYFYQNRPTAGEVYISRIVRNGENMVRSLQKVVKKSSRELSWAD